MSGEASPLVRMVGSQMRQDGSTEAVEWEMGGQFTEADFGEIDAADPQTEAKFMMTCSHVKLNIAGDVVWDIDIPPSRRRASKSTAPTSGKACVRISRANAATGNEPTRNP